MAIALHVPSLLGERALQRAQSWVREQPGRSEAKPGFRRPVAGQAR